MAKTIPQRELRNNNAQVIDAVAGGESFLITRNGVPVAEVSPVSATRRHFVPKRELMELAASGPPVDRGLFRADLDQVIDPEL
jgi:prevent-host-death family protein